MKYNCCNSIGELIKYDAYTNFPFNYTYAVLKHYYTKSVEEFCKKKKRGRAFRPKINFNNKKKKSIVNFYFEYNKKTKEKLILFKKILSLKYYMIL